MKTRFTGQLLAALLGVAFTAEIHAQTAAFTYQGRLINNGSPANGLFDLTFSVWTNSSGPAQVGDTITNLAVPVSNGLFTSTVDFGPDTFTGMELWLEIGVSTNGAGAFSTLSPRQQVTSAPYALHASNAGEADTATSAATVAAGGVANTSLQTDAVTSDKIADGTVAAADLSASLISNTFWRLDGNAGTTAGMHFLGTTDGQPLELKVNGQRAFRLEYTSSNSVNVIGGWLGNEVGPGVVGATIGGGGAGDYWGDALSNRVSADFSTIGGGWGNTIETGAMQATIGGGQLNAVADDCREATIAGGAVNKIQDKARGATIGGGFVNTIEPGAVGSVIAAGAWNSILSNATASTIGGGSRNIIQTNADYSTIGGGERNTIQNETYAATIAGGERNRISSGAGHSVISGGLINEVQTNAFRSSIGGGQGNTIQNDAWYARIGGGIDNVVQSNLAGAFIGGGQLNLVGPNSGFASLSGGQMNQILNTSRYATIGGGQFNTVQNDASWAVIPGGRNNTASSLYAFAAGYRAKANHTSTFVWADTSIDQDFASTAPNQFLLRAAGGVGINTTNPAAMLDVAGTVRAATLELTSTTTISNFNADLLDGRDSSAFWGVGGNSNTIAGTHFLGTTDDQPLELKVNGQRALRLEPGGSNSVNVIGGWNRNEISTGLVGATIAGGGGGDYIHGASFTNRVEANFGFIGGGAGNQIDPNAVSATLAGGWENTIEADASVAALLGGLRNTIEPDASYSTLGGGVENTIGSIAYYATLGGGENNLVYSNADYATIPGGHFNTATNYAFAAGNRAKARHTGAFVWADSTDQDFPSTANNQFLIRATGGVGINTTNPAAMLDVAGTVRAATLELTSTTTISNFNADLLDGRDSSAFWGVGGNSNTIAGTHFLGTTDDQPLELKVNGQRALRLDLAGSNSVNVVGGWEGNVIDPGVIAATIGGGGAGDYQGEALANRVRADAGTISGGMGNRIETGAYDSTIGGGAWNMIQADAFKSTIAGGEENTIAVDARTSTIGGGWVNTIHTNADWATIGGGTFNTIQPQADSATIGGGNDNTVATEASNGTISGGYHNRIRAYATAPTIGGGGGNTVLTNASYATIPGGYLNAATNFAFAAGRRAKANHTGAFVWADSTDEDFPSTANNQFLIRATGGVGINTTNPTATLDVAGTVRAATIELTSSTTISNFNADLLDGLEGSAFWSIGGNTGTLAGTHFLGTADNQPLELKANRQRVLRLEPDTNGAPNVIGGAPLNVVDPGIMGATIGGGGATNSFSPYLPGGQLPGINRVSAHFGTVAGGGENSIERDALGAAVGGGLYNQTASNAVVATICGGALNVIGTNANGGSIGGGYLNSIDMNAYQATISGGSNNIVQANAAWSSIGGGMLNFIQTSAALGTIAGGVSNQIQAAAFSSVIGGGERNVIQHDAVQSTIAGGAANIIWNNTFHAAIPGGFNNEVAGSYGFAAGRRAKANHAGSFVWADSQNADFVSTTANQFRVRADGGVSVVAGSTGLDGAACRIESTAGNGVGLWVTQTSSDSTAVLANTGIGDLLKAYNPGLVFRLDNAGNVYATSFTGSGAGLTGLNASQLTSGTVPSARLSGTYSGAVSLNNPANSFSGNGSGLTSLNASQLTSGTVNDARLSANVARLNSSPTFTGTVTAGGDLQGNGRLVVGSGHSVTGTYSSVAGGSTNSNHGSRSCIGGGQSNGIAAGADHTAISGGQGNTASADWVAISGGQNNNASGNWATVGGGYDCQANNSSATVAGGYNNTASGNSATIPGGADNTASGNYSFGAGRFAQATHTASIVLSGGETTASWGDRTFTVRAHGGVRFYSATGTGTGVQLAAGGNSWSAVSDRAVKENFTQVDPCEVLEKVASLPVTTWNLKSQPEEIRHIGPMAQDFAAAFAVGEDDRHISSSDADGVALAAIQGLNRKLEDTVAELKLKDSRISALEAELSALKEFVMKQTTGEGQP